MADSQHPKHPVAASPGHSAAEKASSSISFFGVSAGIGLIIIIYLLSLLAGWPQHATALIVDESHHVAPTNSPEPIDAAPPLFTVVPFVFMLGAIAVLPLLHGAKHWWESNLHRFYVAGGLAALTVLYYALVHPHPLVGHFPAHHIAQFNADETIHFGAVGTVLANALLNEYVPFIVLLLSLYTISGGIRIEGNLPARPATNTAFLAVGGLLASFIGTTGAAMILIRPLLATNRERKYVAHSVVFFIFIVCNCGGCLLPLGDPPLFLGYLQGVPFLWTLTLWKQWLFINGYLLAVYWAVDQFYFFPLEEISDIARDQSRIHRLRFAGWQLNGLLLLGVILAVAFLDPSKTLPGTDWHPWLYLREVVQLALVALSLLLGSSHTRRMNHFNFAAMIEVAVLFFGIFMCMQPALQILNVRGAQLGLNNPTKFFWATGTLSSFLDNAPTYLVFFQSANVQTTAPGPGILTLQSGQFMRADLLTAISLGAVFMGAMTYIGNGPNFMVKSIAESQGVRMPTFFGYMAYSCLVLLPLLALLNVLFL